MVQHIDVVIESKRSYKPLIVKKVENFNLSGPLEGYDIYFLW